VEVNKRIGTRLLARVGQRVALRFLRAVPVFGGVVGGSLDAVVCRKVGATAKSLFGRRRCRHRGEVRVTPKGLELRARSRIAPMPRNRMARGLS
jgi:hypothetical protein